MFQYDYFHGGGDDLYVLVENLRLYLESEEIQLASNGGRSLPDGSETAQTPLFLGRRFAEGGNRERMFNSGGSGYTLNKAALKALVVDGMPQYFPHMHTFSEDVMVATILRKVRPCAALSMNTHTVFMPDPHTLLYVWCVERWTFCRMTPRTKPEGNATCRSNQVIT